MGVFKRIALLVFGLSGLFALAALSLPWVGPWTASAKALLYTKPYFTAVEASVFVCAFGLVVCLLRALFTRNRKVVQVSREGGDLITVTRDAIASQAIHVIEEDGRFRARRVVVDAKMGGRVRVYARVQPVQTVDVTLEGRDLHERLMEGLAIVCGNNVDKVQIEFTSAAEYVPPVEEAESADEGYEDVAPHLEASTMPSEAGITVPMGHSGVSADVAPVIGEE